jgi:hypothetical protein
VMVSLGIQLMFETETVKYFAFEKGPPMEVLPIILT